MRGVPYLLLFVSCVFCADVRIDPLVLINQGLVRGQRASDGDYVMFLGVPYAQVDLENPFGEALEAPRFEETIYNAYDGSIRCPQTSGSASETLDCLRLNIFVPNQATSRNPLPVLVWIHGGGFLGGYAGEFGAQNLVRHGVVVVTINYRLGAYGFMCLDDPRVPGNQGLKDQLAALRWIRNNIATFGGNPYNVTLAGQSAGAGSALYQLYADEPRLFQKIIVQSGTPQSEGFFVNADLDAARKIAEHLGYVANDTESALNFLATIPHNLVTAATMELNLLLRPCRETSFSGISNFIETDPYSLSNPRKINNMPVLIGHTEEEAAYIDQSLLYGADYFNIDPFYEKIRNNFNLEEEQLVAAANIVRRFYIGNNAVSPDVINDLEHFEADFVFNHPTQRTITNLLEQNANPVYEYLFSYVGENGVPTASHSAELPYLFTDLDSAHSRTQRSEQDQLIADRITTLWTNFIKYGNPTPSTSDLIPVEWSPVTADSRPYLVIDTDLRQETSVFNERMAFWDLFYSMYGSRNALLRQCNWH